LHHCKSDLLLIRKTRCLSCFIPCLRKNGEEYRSKDGNNSNNHEKFNQGETSTGGETSAVAGQSETIH